jgi:hypothetical protein
LEPAVYAISVFSVPAWLIVSPLRRAIPSKPHDTVYTLTNFAAKRGIGSAALQVAECAHSMSMESVWPLKAAEQTLRLHPQIIEERQGKLGSAQGGVSPGDGGWFSYSILKGYAH